MTTSPNTIRVKLTNPKEAQGALKEELERTRSMLGMIPNVFKVAANSASALTALNCLFESVKKCSLGTRIAEQLALALATQNKCQYCSRAHSALAAGVGLDSREIMAAQKCTGSDSKAQAAITLAIELNRNHGMVNDGFLENVRSEGISDEQIIEIILITIQNLFTHMVNNLARTPCEFPELPSLV